MRYLIILLSFISVLLAENSKQNKTITFIEDPSDPFIIGKIGEIPTSGITFEIIKEIFKEIDGYEAEFLPITPWKRALSLVESGKVDAVSHILKNKKREDTFYFTNKLITGKTVFFYKKERKFSSWKSFKDLEKYSICTVRGYNIEKYLLSIEKEKNVDLNIYITNEFGTCFKLIINDRIDLYAENLHTGIAYLQKVGLENQFTTMKKPVYQKDFFIAFSKKSEAHKLIPQMNKILKKIVQRDMQKDLEKKYLNNNVKN